MEMSRAKTIFALAIVAGCFAILWPKIFYPMLLTSVAPPQKHHQTPSGFCCGVVFESDASVQFMAELCSWVLKNDVTLELTTLPLERGGRPPERVVTLCREELLKKCNVDINDVVRSDVDGVVDRRRKLQGLRAQNLTTCLKIHFDIDEESLLAKKSYPQHPIFIPRHMRPERPPHLHPDIMHPALREKGRVLPPRVPEKPTKPGPVPGMRPPMGGPGHIVPPSRTDSTGSMGILMPIYTVGIVVFFVYTIMKIMFKKSEDQKPLIKDFHLDPEQRKFVFAEEYTTGGEVSMKDYIRRQEKLEELRRSRSKSPVIVQQEEEVQEEMKEETKEEVQEEERKEETKEEAQEEEEVEETPVEETTFAEEQAQKVTSEKEEETVEEDIQSGGEAITIHKMHTGDRELEEEEIDQLRRRLEETEKAMERIVAQMGNVADKLSVPPTDTLNQTATLRHKKEDAAEEEEEEEELIEDKEVEPEVNEAVAIQEECAAVEFIRPECEAGQLSESEPISRAIEEFSELTADKLISEVLVSQTLLEKSLDTCISEADEQVPREDDDRLRRSSSRQSTEDAKLTVMGMEVTVGLGGGKKMSRSPTPVKDLLPKPEKTKVEPPVEYVPSVFLEAALPPDTHLVVSEAECRAEAVPIEQLDLDEMEYETTPVVLSGKMTLSVIGMELVADPASQEESSYAIPERTRPGILREQPSEEDFDSPSRGHRVRFMTEPEEVIIPPSDEFELEEYAPTETVFDDKNEAADNDANESLELLESAAPILVGYRPPTPPIHYENEQEATEESENEFLTYTELEEAGEVAAEVAVCVPTEPEEAGKPAKSQEEESAISAEPESNIDARILADIEQDIVAEQDRAEVSQELPEKEKEDLEVTDGGEPAKIESEAEEPAALQQDVESETIAVSEDIQLVDETPQRLDDTPEAISAVEDLVLQAEEKDQQDLHRGEAETTESEAPAASDEHQHEEGLTDITEDQEVTQTVTEPTPGIAKDSLPQSNLETETERLDNLIAEVASESTVAPEADFVDTTVDAEPLEVTLEVTEDVKLESNLEVEQETSVPVAVEVSSEPVVEPEIELVETAQSEESELQESTLDVAEDTKVESSLELDRETFEPVEEEASSEPTVEPEAELVESVYPEDASTRELTLDVTEDVKVETILAIEQEIIEPVAAEVSSEPVVEVEAEFTETAQSEDAQVQQSTLDVTADVTTETILEIEKEILEPVAAEVSSEPVVEPEADVIETVQSEDAQVQESTLDVTADVTTETILEIEKEILEPVAAEISSEPVVEPEADVIETVQSEEPELEESTLDGTADVTKETILEIEQEILEPVEEEVSSEPVVEPEAELVETVQSEDVKLQKTTLDVTEDAKVESSLEVERETFEPVEEEVSSESAVVVEAELVETVRSEVPELQESTLDVTESAERENSLELERETLESVEAEVSSEPTVEPEAELVETVQSEEVKLQESTLDVTEDAKVESSLEVEREILEPVEEEVSSEPTVEPEAELVETVQSEDVKLQESTLDVTEDAKVESSLEVERETLESVEEEISSEPVVEPEVDVIETVQSEEPELQESTLDVAEDAKVDSTLEVERETFEPVSSEPLVEPEADVIETVQSEEPELQESTLDVTEDAKVESSLEIEKETFESVEEEVSSEPEAELVETAQSEHADLQQSTLDVAEDAKLESSLEVETEIIESVEKEVSSEPVAEPEAELVETVQSEDAEPLEIPSHITEDAEQTAGDTAESWKATGLGTTELESEVTPDGETLEKPEEIREDTPIETGTTNETIETVQITQQDEPKHEPRHEEDTVMASCNVSEAEEIIEVPELPESDAGLTVTQELRKNPQGESLEEADQSEEKTVEVDPVIAEREAKEAEEELAFEVIDKSEIAAMEDSEVSQQADEHEVVTEDPLNGSHDGPDIDTGVSERAQSSTDEGSGAVDNQSEIHVLHEEKNTAYEQTDNNSVDDGSYSPDSLEPVKDLAETAEQTAQEQQTNEAELITSEQSVATEIPPAEEENVLPNESTEPIREASDELETRAQDALHEESSQQLAAESEVPPIPEPAAGTIASPDEEPAGTDPQETLETSALNEDGVLKTEQQTETIEHAETLQEADAVIEPISTDELGLERTVTDDSPDNRDGANIDSHINLVSSDMTEETDSGRSIADSKAEEGKLTGDSSVIDIEQDSEVAESKEDTEPVIADPEPVVDGTPDSSQTIEISLEPTSQGSDRESESLNETSKVEEDTPDTASTTVATEEIVATDVVTEGLAVSSEEQLEKTAEVTANTEDHDTESVEATNDPMKEETTNVEEQSSVTDSTDGSQKAALADADVLEPAGPDSDPTRLDDQNIPEAGEQHQDEDVRLPTDDIFSKAEELDTTIAQIPAEETKEDLDSTHEVKERIDDSKPAVEDYPEESEITCFQPRPAPDIPDSLLMEIEAQIIPSESYLLGATYERDSVAVHVPYLHQYESTEEPIVEPLCQEYRDYQRDREVEEMEHTLETLPAHSSEREGPDSSGSERKASVKSETEEPVISQFVIREDYPDDGLSADEDDVPLTEEDILQARKEIDEIRKLLAHVSYTEGDYAADDSHSEGAQSTPEEIPRHAETQKSKEDLEAQLAHAMLEEDPIPASSKGSSPDMEEYEVVGNGQKGSPVTEHEKSSGAAPLHSGAVVSEHPSPLTPTTEASFERINATEQTKSESQ